MRWGALAPALPRGAGLMVLLRSSCTYRPDGRYGRAAKTCFLASCFQQNDPSQDSRPSPAPPFLNSPLWSSSFVPSHLSAPGLV